MTTIMIRTHGYIEGGWSNVDPALFVVERYLEHHTEDEGMVAVVQCEDIDGKYTHVYIDRTWAFVRSEVMSMANLFDLPIVIFVTFGSVNSIDYGPTLEDDWFEVDDEDEESED